MIYLSGCPKHRRAANAGAKFYDGEAAAIKVFDPRY
jgi:hypothetical protein